MVGDVIILRKKGNPEDLSIRLLREILDEMGEPYSKSWKKGVLIEKVRAAREGATTQHVQPLSETPLPQVTKEL